MMLADSALLSIIESDSQPMESFLFKYYLMFAIVIRITDP